jgi:hypothetical protein
MTVERDSRLESEEGATKRPIGDRGTGSRSAGRERVRRFELGVFVRKVVNGWVTFYKQFPPQDRAQVHARQQASARANNDPPEFGDNQMMMMAKPKTGDTTDGGVTQKSGTSPGSGDGGPVGSTRYEIGAFVSTTTTVSDDDEDS